MPKRKPPTHEPFESMDIHGRFAKICHSMLNSLAWKSLEPSQMGLYVVLKQKYTKTKSGDDNRRNITFPYSEYSKVKTYTNQRVFWRDLDALIEAGFIQVVSSGKVTRTPTIYGFSDGWKKYGTPEFSVTDGQRRATRKK